MMTGWEVKIPDIGLATVVQPGRTMVKLDLEGEQLWMPVNLVSVVKEAA